MPQTPALSVVIPMFNEAENVARTIGRVAEATEHIEGGVEVLLVDDGSTDGSAARAREVAAEYEAGGGNVQVTVAGYPDNRGRGHAMRHGFSAASGAIVVSVDADLSYTPDHVVQIYEAFQKNPRADIVVGSCYMPGGRTENVPPKRLFISQAANVILGFALGGNLRTVTGILRGYKREVFPMLDLESDGKELHLEIISKAQAMGLHIVEIPAVLRGREYGSSKFKFQATTFSHLLFSFSERPSILFGAIGLGLLALGLLVGFYIFILYLGGNLNPVRPLVTVLVLLVISGIQAISLGFLGSMVAGLRQEIYKVRRDLNQLRTERE